MALGISSQAIAPIASPAIFMWRSIGLQERLGRLSILSTELLPGADHEPELSIASAEKPVGPDFVPKPEQNPGDSQG